MLNDYCGREEPEEQRHVALGHPKEITGPHSLSDCVQPQRDNQIPKTEGSVQSKEQASLGGQGSQPRTNRIGGRGREWRHASRGPLNNVFIACNLLYHHQQDTDGTSIQVRIHSSPSGRLGCNPNYYKKEGSSTKIGDLKNKRETRKVEREKLRTVLLRSV